ncbi:MAG: replication initiator protein A [Oscillospiraceae bacterium]|nr:replication initiator protein A [Oscillospiraceae bacterium]
MAQQPSHDYHYGHEADHYTFYRLPKALFTHTSYKSLSDGAKILYGLMLDRMGLSIKNGWLDEEGRVFIYFTLDDVKEYMNCRQDKSVKLLAELDTVKGVGLIERVKQGQGKPTIIYVKKFVHGTEVLTSEKPRSGLPDLPKSAYRKSRSQDIGKTDTNKNELSNTDRNKNEFNHTEYQSNPIYPAADEEETGPSPCDGIDKITAYRHLIRGNIEYDSLVERYGAERLDEVVELVLETVCSRREHIRIAGDDCPAEVVKSRLLKIGPFHVEYVFDCIDRNTTKVHNIKAYLLTALYNAPATMDSYYRAEVNHDLYGSGP